MYPSQAPVTPSVAAESRDAYPAGPPPMRRPNPRKRPLPSPSPAHSTFASATAALAGPSRPSTRVRARAPANFLASFAFGSPKLDATPFAPLLPPAPIFKKLPLPESSTSPMGPHSSPMKRSPAIASLAQFTAEAHREADGFEKQDERRWIARSISRFELKAFGAPLPYAAPSDYDDEERSASPTPDFHLELSSPDLSPLPHLRPATQRESSFDELASIQTPGSDTSCLSSLSWTSSLPSLSSSSSTSTLSDLGSPSPLLLPSPSAHSAYTADAVAPHELARALSLASISLEPQGVSKLALRRFEKRQRDKAIGTVPDPSALGLGLTLHP
ncbi:hypothetical protein JCM8202_003747 [Rhodotorula sphaerocarpa]